MVCRTAAGLISRSLDAPLGAPERAGLAVHTAFCGPCRRLRRQLARLHAAALALAEREAAGSGGLSPEARGRIAAALARLSG